MLQGQAHGLVINGARSHMSNCMFQVQAPTACNTHRAYVNACLKFQQGEEIEKRLQGDHTPLRVLSGVHMYSGTRVPTHTHTQSDASIKKSFA